MVVNLIGLGVGFATSYLVAGPEFAWGEAKSWALFTLASVIAGNLILFLLSWVLSAGRIAQEDRETIASLASRIEQYELSDQRIAQAKITELKLVTADLLAQHVERSLSHPSGVFNQDELGKWNDRKSALNSNAMLIGQSDKELGSDIRSAVHLADCILADKVERALNFDEREELQNLANTVLSRLMGSYISRISVASTTSIT